MFTGHRKPGYTFFFAKFVSWNQQNNDTPESGWFTQSDGFKHSGKLPEVLFNILDEYADKTEVCVSNDCLLSE